MTSDTKECPFCAETIKAEAIYCRFCQHYVDGREHVSATGDEVGGDKISVGDLKEVHGGAIGEGAQAATTGEVRGHFIQSQGGNIRIGINEKDFEILSQAHDLAMKMGLFVSPPTVIEKKNLDKMLKSNGLASEFTLEWKRLLPTLIRLLDEDLNIRYMQAILGRIGYMGEILRFNLRVQLGYEDPEENKGKYLRMERQTRWDLEQVAKEIKQLMENEY